MILIWLQGYHQIVQIYLMIDCQEYRRDVCVRRKGGYGLSALEFNGPVTTIRTGETVYWINRDEAPHRVKSDLFNSPTLNKGDVFKFTFIEKGTYDYTCGIHPSMKGQIIVK